MYCIIPLLIDSLSSLLLISSKNVYLILLYWTDPESAVLNYCFNYLMSLHASEKSSIKILNTNAIYYLVFH